MDSRQSKIAASYIWEFSALNGQIIMPPKVVYQGWQCEVVDGASEMIRDKVARCCVYMEQVGDIVAGQSKICTG
jgi:hypothetical protein